MNENYLFKLQEDMRLKNFTQNTCDDYYRFVKRFLEYCNKDARSITYADIRKFIFHMKDEEGKKPSTNHGRRLNHQLCWWSGLLPSRGMLRFRLKAV